MGTPYNVCLPNEDVISRAQKMSISKVVGTTLMISELLIQTRPQTQKWTVTIMDRAMKQCFPNDGLKD